MKKKFELYLTNIIKGRKKGFFPRLVKGLLLPLSWCYGLGSYFHNVLYDKKWACRYVPPVPLVISVGNIVAGGTGKTPVTLLLASVFYGRFHLAILSRGYRSKAEKLDTPVVLCEGNGPIFPASYCGDEPYLFAKRLPKSLVIVGADRKKSSLIASKEGAQVILLDDGMQHRRLARDFDIVVIDIGDPFGQRHFLPRGFLRERIGSLERADLIVLNHVQDEEQLTCVQKEIRLYTHAPMIGTKVRVTAIRDLKGQESGELKGVPVGMFCAIAHPEYFKSTLEQEGFTIVNELLLSDHHTFHKKNLEQFAQACLKKGATYLICTEKDRVKLEDDLKLVLPILWVQLELDIVAGQTEWQHFIERAESKII